VGQRTIAKYWKTGVTYITFLSPPGNFSQERNIEPYIRFDDGALTGWAFTFNAYVKLFYAISGDSTVVVGNRGDTYDVEIGFVPTLDLKKITGTPLTIAAPTWVTVGPTSYLNRGVTGCGATTMTEACPLSNAGVFTTGLALKESLDWLVPTRWGNWYGKGGFQYYHIINDSLLLAQTFHWDRQLLSDRASRGVGRLCGLGLHLLSIRMKPDVSRLEPSTNLRGSEHGTSGFSFVGCRPANAAPAGFELSVDR